MDLRLETGRKDNMRRETKYTRIPPAVYRRVLERDSGACVLCGSYYGLECAHYIGRAHGGLGREENLVMLCGKCHKKYDHTDERKFIRPELREYLQGIYPEWDESKLVYKKGME
jgi:5-methylcytosine-specific restriction endonuclease McrA